MAVKKSSKKKNKQKNSKNTKRKKKTVAKVKKKTLSKKVTRSLSEKAKKNISKTNKTVKENVIKRENTKKSYKGLILASLIILSLILLVLYFPWISLSGEENTVISYKDKYVEPGYHGYILNKDITKDIQVSSNINSGVVGNYEVNYYLSLFGARVKKTRFISIIDNISPVINVNKDTINICPNEDVPNIEYEAIDEYDGDITSKVKNTIKNDEILLEVDDLSNNTTSLTIKINRTDTEHPKIELKGNSVMYLTYGEIYNEPGYIATDNCDKDLTNKVVVSGTVGRDIGTYELTYEVTDIGGNKTTVKRKIIIGIPINDNGSMSNGTIYLTFDDGPNPGTTDRILDILKEENIKATFFVTNKGPDYLIKRIYDEGHTIALHTSTHDYAYIYSSIDNYFNDLNQIKERVKRITGVDSQIIRFPGGSSNTISRNYKIGIMTELTSIVLYQGYRYYDWNIDGMDASTARNSSDVYYNVTSHLSHNRGNVVLLHDTKTITADALRDIIKFGKEYGYIFSGINMDTQMIRHPIYN